MIDELVKECERKKDIYGEKVSFSSLDDRERLALELYLHRLRDMKIDTEFIVDAYFFMMNETRKEQIYYYRNKKMQRNVARQIQTEIYSNYEYMKKYMIGLAISTFLWEQHRILFRFYTDFLKQEINRNSKFYIEIGAGSGLYSLLASRAGYHMGRIVDISMASIELSEQLISEEKVPFEYECANFMECDENNDHFDTIVTNEVVQAVDDPEEFIRKCYAMLKNDGRLYISTPVNSPMMDVLERIRGVHEMKGMLLKRGFVVEDELVIPYRKYTLSYCEQKRLPINMAFIARKEV